MTHDFLPQQQTLFDDPVISETPNRRGVRVQIHSDLVDAFVNLVALTRPDVVAEIGAHEASFSQKIRTALPTSKIVAFEANPKVYEQFRSRTDFSSLGIDYRHEAVADIDGTVSFHIVVGLLTGVIGQINAISSINLRANTAVQSEMVEIPATTLDRAIAHMGESFCLWIDVEGAQKQVLEGGKRVLPQVNSLMIEVEDYAFWNGQILNKNIESILAGHGLVPIMIDCEADRQHNVVFIQRQLLVNEGVATIIRQYTENIHTRIKSAHDNSRQS